MTLLTKEKRHAGKVYFARFGFDLDFARRNNQLPHLSVTGEEWDGEPMRRTGRNLVSMGCCHDMIAREFPDVAPLLPFHLHTAPDGEPMHYVANAKYWHDMVTGRIRERSWFDAKQDTAENGRRCFLSHVVEHVAPVPVEVWTMDHDALERWLADRLPMIRTAMMAACKAAGVPWPA